MTTLRSLAVFVSVVTAAALVGVGLAALVVAL